MLVSKFIVVIEEPNWKVESSKATCGETVAKGVCYVSGLDWVANLGIKARQWNQDMNEKLEQHPLENRRLEKLRLHALQRPYQTNLMCCPRSFVDTDKVD